MKEDKIFTCGFIGFWVLWATMFLAGLGLTGFTVWVIFKLLQYFGVV